MKPMSSAPAPAGRDSLVLADDGSTRVPASDADWDDWVSAGRTRNHLQDDPLLDWLDRHGRAKGFVPDQEHEGFDPRTDFLTLVLERGTTFEERVIELVARSVPVVRIASGWEDARDLARAERTLDAMRAGELVIHQAVLRNPETRTYGSADLLIRSDVLERLVPGTLTPDEIGMPAPALGPHPWHYRVVDIKFTTLHLAGDRSASAKHRAYMGQVWVYNEALGRMQG